MTSDLQPMQLAYDDRGAGTPVVLLHGLTFDRTTWAPVVERLGDDVRTLAIDLPGHGQTGGEARRLDDVAAAVHDLVTELGLDRPIVVGHSMAAGVAGLYGSQYPALGIVSIDSHPDLRAFAELIRRMEPALTGADFAAAFEPFQMSMGLDRVPEPLRSRVLAVQDVRADLVLGYWEEVMRADPHELRAWIDQSTRSIHVPFLAIFGRTLAADERDYLVDRVAELRLEEWPGRGHFVHLADVERFSQRLRAFIATCTAERAHQLEVADTPRPGGLHDAVPDPTFIPPAAAPKGNQ